MNDADALAASRSDPQAFVQVFDRHFDGIHRYLRRRVGTWLADDLAAATFTEAFATRGRYDERRSDARPWLYGIAINLLSHHYRDEERELRAYARTGVDPVAPDEPRLVLESAHPDRDLAEALADLRDEERETLLLYAWAELSYAEIAEALAVPIGTVRSRLSRARQAMREVLTGEEESAAAAEAKENIDG